MSVTTATMKLGKRPRRHDLRTLQMARYLAGAGQAQPLRPPASVDYTHGITDWGSMLNDQLGCCTIAAVGHAVQAWTANALGRELTVPDSAILNYYEKWDGYDPANASSDQGGVELDVLNNWRQQGFDGVSLDAYVAVELGAGGSGLGTGIRDTGLGTRGSGLGTRWTRQAMPQTLASILMYRSLIPSPSRFGFLAALTLASSCRSARRTRMFGMCRRSLALRMSPDPGADMQSIWWGTTHGTRGSGQGTRDKGYGTRDSQLGIWETKREIQDSEFKIPKPKRRTPHSDFRVPEAPFQILAHKAQFANLVSRIPFPLSLIPSPES